VWQSKVRGAAAFNNDTGGGRTHRLGTEGGWSFGESGRRWVVSLGLGVLKSEDADADADASASQACSRSGCVALGALACFHRKGHLQHFNNTQREIPNCCTPTARSSLRRCAHLRPRSLTGPVRRLLATRPPFTRTLQTPQAPPSHMQHLLACNNSVSL
jgi:hypothetical protein